MRVEYQYAARAGIDEAAAGRRTAVYYYRTGEQVGPGRYVCTFCGKDVMVAGARTLPPCQTCDSTEYSLEAAA